MKMPMNMNSINYFFLDFYPAFFIPIGCKYMDFMTLLYIPFCQFFNYLFYPAYCWTIESIFMSYFHVKKGKVKTPNYTQKNRIMDKFIFLKKKVRENNKKRN